MEKDLPITILSCDNMQMNGNAAKYAFMSYFEAKYPEVAAWAKKESDVPEFDGGSNHSRNKTG